MMASEMWGKATREIRLDLIALARTLDEGAFAGAFLQYRAIATWEQLAERQRKAIIEALRMVAERRQKPPEQADLFAEGTR